MPGLSGVGLQERLMRLGNAIPIIFVSAHGDVPMVARAMRDGAFDFLQKPFNEQHLLIASRRPFRWRPGGATKRSGWRRSRAVLMPDRPGARCHGRDGRRPPQQADRR
jgi:FixJ family two-component response regulator